MSQDTLMLLRTPFTAAEVRAALADDPALAHLGLVDRGERGGVGCHLVKLAVRPWREDDYDLIPDGFETATVTVTLMIRRGEEEWQAMMRVVAAILRLVPGDVCLADQDAAGPDLLRLQGVVYVRPDGFGADNLARYGHTPERLVIGIPSLAAVAEQAR